MNNVHEWCKINLSIDNLFYTPKIIAMRSYLESNIDYCACYSTLYSSTSKFYIVKLVWNINWIKDDIRLQKVFTQVIQCWFKNIYKCVYIYCIIHSKHNDINSYTNILITKALNTPLQSISQTSWVTLIHFVAREIFV